MPNCDRPTHHTRRSHGRPGAIWMRHREPARRDDACTYGNTQFSQLTSPEPDKAAPRATPILAAKSMLKESDSSSCTEELV